jgi:hypothetical protein
VNAAAPNQVPGAAGWLSALRWLAFAVLGGILSVTRGQDANWDLANYHLYNAFALLDGRVGLDPMVASVQSGFNPALDLPFYWLSMGPLAELPRVLAFMQGAWFGLLMAATWRLARLVLPRAEPLLSWLAVAIAGTAGATWANIGASYNDIPVAALLLWAIAIALAAKEEGSGELSPCRLIVTGALLGAASGLKLTALAFVPGAVVAVAVVAPDWRSRVRVLGWIAFGFVMAMVLTLGPWAWLVWRRYGNPIFPLMNSLFRSEWYPPISVRDLRYLPRSALQAVFYPFWWIRWNLSVSEYAFRDARLALTFLAVPVLGLGLLFGRAWDPNEGKRRRLASLLAFVVIGFAVWEALFSIFRYIQALEAVAAILIVAAARVGLSVIPACRNGSRRCRLGAVLSGCGVLALLLVHTHPPHYRHVAFAERQFRFDVPVLPANSLVLVGEPPVAIAVPFLAGPAVRFVGVGWATLVARGYRLFDETREAIAAHPTNLFIVTRDLGPNAAQAELAFGFNIVRESCAPLDNNITPPGEMLFCAVRKQE